MKIILPMALVATCLNPCHAQSVKVAPWMTGQRLVDLQTLPAVVKNSLQLTATQLADDRRADSYMDGVHDATEGKGWCFSEKYKPKPDTIKENIIWGLRRMSAEQLKRNAADLIVEILAAKYPCAKAQGGRP